MGKILKILKHSVLKFALLMSFKGLLCFRNCEGCITCEVYARKTSGNLVCGPTLKEKLLASHQKRLANDCVCFIGLSGNVEGM